MPKASLDYGSALGWLSLTFNHNMMVPDDISLINYDQVFRIILTAADDRSQILGKYAGLDADRESEDDRRRRRLKGVPLIRNCAETCDSINKDFEWTVVNHDKKEIML